MRTLGGPRVGAETGTETANPSSVAPTAQMAVTLAASFPHDLDIKATGDGTLSFGSELEGGFSTSDAKEDPESAKEKRVSEDCGEQSGSKKSRKAGVPVKAESRDGAGPFDTEGKPTKLKLQFSLPTSTSTSPSNTPVSSKPSKKSPDRKSVV